MEHPAFEEAGQTKGIEIWRIEDFEPVPVPPGKVGKFYNGDSYIVLHTKESKSGRLSWDIHFWLGSQTSQDKSGTAAIMTVVLSDKLAGGAVHHREVQGHESSQFLGCFKPAIRYLDGGHDSGFQNVETNAGSEKRLFQVKGNQNIRVKQVEPDFSSMNKGDCFILDVDLDVFVYVGEHSSRIERLKAISVANQIRDEDHNGRGSVHIIDEFSCDSELESFFSALGSGCNDSMPEENDEDDQAFEDSDEHGVTLYQVSDGDESLKVISHKPLKRELLDSSGCYILDSITCGLYVWVGKDADSNDRSEATTKANEFITTRNYPSWVHVTRVPEGAEPAAFKQYFQTWGDFGISSAKLIRAPSDTELYESDEEVAGSRARQVGKSGAARGFIPDDGHSSDIAIYRIEDSEPVPVNYEETMFGQFYQEDSYIITYDYQPEGKEAKHIIYCWLGKKTSEEDAAAAALHAARMDEEMEDTDTVQIRVPQGEEPTHFLKIFQGKFVIHFGGKSSEFKKTNENDSYDQDGIRLYRIFGNKKDVDMRAEQIPELSPNLDEDNVFMLESPTEISIWWGKDASQAEIDVAEEFADLIFGSEKKKIVITPEEESESAEVRALIGDMAAKADGEKQEWKRNLRKRAGHEPRLFNVSVFSSGRVAFEEVADFTQEDLLDEDVFLLDVGDEIYIWIGLQARERAKKATSNILQTYLKKDALDRTPKSTAVFTIKRGREPYAFKKVFDDWDVDIWQNQISYDDLKAKIIGSNTID